LLRPWKYSKSDFLRPSDSARLAIGGQAVQVGVERIGEVASVGVPRGGVANDGAGRAIQLGAKLRHEEIPRGWIAQAACDGQRKIGRVQALEIRVDFLGIGRRARKSPRGAAFQSGLKLLARQVPIRRHCGFAPAAFNGRGERRRKLQSCRRRMRGRRDLPGNRRCFRRG